MEPRQTKNPKNVALKLEKVLPKPYIMNNLIETAKIALTRFTLNQPLF
jgi:hypothetical protein